MPGSMPSVMTESQRERTGPSLGVYTRDTEKPKVATSAPAGSRQVAADNERHEENRETIDAEIQVALPISRCAQLFELECNFLRYVNWHSAHRSPLNAPDDGLLRFDAGEIVDAQSVKVSDHRRHDRPARIQR